jgi:RNA recognition motif-containing protein
MTERKHLYAHDLWIGNLSPVTSKSDLLDHIEALGFEVEFAWIEKRNVKTGANFGKCWCTIKLANPEQRREAEKALHLSELHGRTLWCHEYKSNQKRKAERARIAAKRVEAPPAKDFSARLRWARAQETMEATR